MILKRNAGARYARNIGKRRSYGEPSNAFSQLLSRLVQHKRWRQIEGMVMQPDGRPDILSPATAGCMLYLLGECGPVSVTRDVAGWRVGVDIYRRAPAPQTSGKPTSILGQAIAETLLTAWNQEEQRQGPKGSQAREEPLPMQGWR